MVIPIKCLLKMAIKITDFGGTDWADGEILYSADLIETIKVPYDKLKFHDEVGVTKKIEDSDYPITFKTITIGGGFSGRKIVDLFFKLYSAGNTGYNVKILRNGRVIEQTYGNNYSQWSAGLGNYSYPHARFQVANGDSITIVLTLMGGSAADVTMSEIDLYSTDPILTAS